VSEWVKSAAKLRLVSIGKMSESEPPMTYREDAIVVKTGGAADLRDKYVRSLITARTATGIQAA